MSEKLPPQEIRPSFTQTIAFAENIIRGEYATDFPPEESLDPAEVFVGPILDLNDPDLHDVESAMVMDWIDKKLGTKVEEAPVKGTYSSPDGETTVVIYDVPLGLEEDEWYISKWQNEGEKPSYVFWSAEMYEEQVELAYEEIVE